MKTLQPESAAEIPTYHVGPLPIVADDVQGAVTVPLATLEAPLAPSVNRGARVARACDPGIRVTLVSECMTRSVVFAASDAAAACDAWQAISVERDAVAEVVAGTSRFCRLKDLHAQIVGRLLYIRMAAVTGDAAGHNMVTQAADAFVGWIGERFPQLEYVSISGNLCTDKKVSAVNGILGRGKHMIAELDVPRPVCEKLLRTTPEAIVSLNERKNLLGGILAGSLRSANAHFANMLLGFYLATGQDAANIVEGSQGITSAEATDTGLYFAVTLPNLIVGAVGSGKDLPWVRQNLALIGCDDNSTPGTNARRVATVCAATVLCGELSLLAAQTNPGELMRAHRVLERGQA